ncbi:protein FAM210B, mitochondrial isoform X2 [Gadus macrocephalus]|uniref:protein FAM210B, mitochondrial isoform X2 n=1 Tax=Gadus macrocephalus TaxID=80720 RepID=UPI0028CBB2A2|nr:protein FAM210B, mitochondrial isoform X2 [Gadus macrocephalus]
MFFCRGARLSLSPLDQAFKSSALVPCTANRPRNITWTLPNKYVLHDRRSLSTSNANLDYSTVPRSEKTYITIKKWDSSSPFITTDLTRLNRKVTIASHLHRSLPKVTYGAQGDEQIPMLANRCSAMRAEVVDRGLFWDGGTICSPLGAAMTVQTRASSTAAAAKKPGQETGETDNKGEEQHSKGPLTSPSPASPTGPEGMEPEPDRPSKAQQLKKVFKEYGAVGVSFHVCISLMSLGMFYLLVSSGIDMAAVLCKLGFSEAVVQSKMAAGTSTFVLAYAVHKLFAPVRISISLVSVPLIVRYLRRTGLFKTPAP